VYLVKPNFYKQLISSYEGVLVDSAVVAPDGTFSFKNLSWLREKGIYMLFVQPTNSRFYQEIASPPPAENYACLVLTPGEHIRLKADIWAFTRSYQLQDANAENRQIARLRDYREPFYREFEILHPAADSLHAWSTHGSEAVQDSVNAAFDDFLDTAQALLPVFAALRLRAPDNEFRDRPELFIRVLERLQQQAPGNPWVAQLGVFLDRSKLPVLVGERMPDFALPTPEGDTLRLADVQNKLLLVDFWASWCAPCRAETRETIRPLYDEYHARGFNVLGISIDRSREAWTAAIRKDGAVWANVSDLLGDPSPVRQDLKFEYIPANYLIDADGRLLARNLHKEELRIFVQKYFEQQ
jgi:peroxiredoxin